MSHGFPTDVRSDLTWDELNDMFIIDPSRGTMRWRNPPGFRARFLAGQEAGCHKHTLGYVHIGIGQRYYKRSRLMWFFVHKSWPRHDIDHINGDRADDRISNLRDATRHQNMANARTRADSTTGFKGIHWDQNRWRWRARITVGRKEIHLGRFTELEAALAARSIAEKKYHGEFARAR